MLTGAIRTAAVVGLLAVSSLACRDRSSMSPGPIATDSVPSSLEAGSAASAVDDACDRAVDTNWVTFGTVNTIVVPSNADVIDVEVVPEPARVCPGGSFAVELQVTNRGDDEALFAPNRGLLLQSGGMANWEIAPIAPVMVPAGGTSVIDLTATIANVAPGHYRLAAEGYRRSVGFEVVLPTGPISTTSLGT